MALEQEHRITFIGGSENIISESEEVKITPPARRKKAEKMKNKAGRNSPLPASDEVAINDGCSNRPATLPAKVSLKQDEKEDVEPQALNNEVLSHGEAVNSEQNETKTEVLKDSWSNEVSMNDSNVNCVENSFVEPNDLAAYANDTNLVQSSNETEVLKGDLTSVSENKYKDDPELVEGGENSRGSCISPDISASASHDEESFFSAEEAETTQELQSLTLHELSEVVNETFTELENIEDPSPVNSENTNPNKSAILDEGSCQEISQTQISDCLDQRSTFESLQEPLEDTPGLHKSVNENLSTEASFIESTASDGVEAVRVDSLHSHLSVDTDPGATGGGLESDSDSDEEWSSSSYTSSEGEYDIGFAEKVRGIQVSSL